jgi:hypothetical protein
LRQPGSTQTAIGTPAGEYPSGLVEREGFVSLLTVDASLRGEGLSSLSLVLGRRKKNISRGLIGFCDFMDILAPALTHIVAVV